MASRGYDPHSSFPPQIGDSVLGHGSTTGGGGGAFGGHGNANSWLSGGGDASAHSHANAHSGLSAGTPEPGGGKVNGGGAGAGAAGRDRFLKQAEGLEITREDRQEGYDPNLIHSLQPRTGQADAAAQAAANRDSSVPRASSELREPIIPASSKPYESRAVGGKVKTSSSSGAAGRANGAQSDLEKKTPGGRGARRRRQKKKKPFFKDRRTWLFGGIILLLLIGLGVGLGAGLGIKKNNTSASPSNSIPPGVTVSPTSPGVTPATTGSDVARTTPTIVPSITARAYNPERERRATRWV